jgi:hypothetical protein
MKSSPLRTLIIVATAQLLLAVSVALLVGVVCLLQSMETQFYSRYTGQFTPADDSPTTPRGPLGFTPAGFAHVAHSNAQQLGRYTSLAVVASGILLAISVFQLLLARRVRLREDSSHANAANHAL